MLGSPPTAKAADDRLQFTGTTISGSPFNGASLAGKPAVLWFWTPRCPFCNAEAPSHLEPRRINVYERWESRSAVEALRGSDAQDDARNDAVVKGLESGRTDWLPTQRFG